MKSNAERNHPRLGDTFDDAEGLPVGPDGMPRNGRRLGFIGRWMGGWPLETWPGNRSLVHRWSPQARALVSWLQAPDSYWRRRFFILLAGLILLGLATWGLSALIGPAKPIPAASPARTSPAMAGPLPAWPVATSQPPGLADRRGCHGRADGLPAASAPATSPVCPAPASW